jgi:hypothetical protein
MKTLTVNKLGMKSPNLDLEHCDLPPEIFTFGNNFRLVNGKIKSFNAVKSLATPPSNFYAGHVVRVAGASITYYVIIGRTRAYAFDGTTWSDITSLASTNYSTLGVNDELFWHSCKLGQIPIFNNQQWYPEYWSPQQAGVKLVALNFSVGVTWQAKGYQAKVIRSHGNYLFALNLTEGATKLPTTYRWSHPADTNGLPFTWDEADLSAIAGKASISGNGGELVDGLSLRDSFCIYSERSIHILDNVGGEFIWKRRLLTDNYGLIAKNCLVEALGVHYFMSDGDVMMNDGNSVQSILHGKIKSAYVDNLDGSSYATSFAVVNSIMKEIWFCYPQNGQTLPSTAIIYNYVDGTLAIRDLRGTHTAATIGPVLSAPITWATVADSWTSINQIWSYDPTSRFSNGMVGVDRITSSIYSFEVDDGSTTQNTVLERQSMAVEGQEIAITTVSLYPHLTCAGSVSIQLGSQSFVGAPIRWKPAVLFDPNTMRKVDIRSTGTLLSWRITSVGTVPFTLTGMDIEYVVNGVR